MLSSNRRQTHFGNFDYVNEGSKKGDALLPKVQLFGFYKTNWKAAIDINQFVKTAEWLNI